MTSRLTRAIPAARGAPSVDDAFGLLERAVRDGEVPGAVAAVGTADGILRRAHFGYAALEPALRVLREDALFDLASVTKIVATTTLVLRLIEQGVIFLNQRVAAVLPAFGALGKDAVTVRDLLTHTSGMPSPARGWREQFSRGAPHPSILDLICRTPLERPTGEAVHYSDSGFFILGAFLVAAGGAPLDELVRREVTQPLALTDTVFRPLPRLRARSATTEVVSGRGGAVCGSVHDEMAATAGGAARAWRRRGPAWGDTRRAASRPSGEALPTPPVSAGVGGPH